VHLAYLFLVLIFILVFVDLHGLSFLVVGVVNVAVLAVLFVLALFFARVK
jgi:hypothetical protein